MPRIIRAIRAGRPPWRKAVDAGAQLDFRFSALNVLDMTLSVGGAMAFEDGHAPRREAMISLKVLR